MTKNMDCHQTEPFKDALIRFYLVSSKYRQEINVSLLSYIKNTNKLIGISQEFSTDNAAFVNLVIQCPGVLKGFKAVELLCFLR